MTDSQHDRVDERLRIAVEGLACGLGTLQTRLANAVITLVPLQAANFHDADARRKFVGILDDLSFVGSAPETVPKLSDEDAAAVAARICELCWWALRTAS